MAMKPKTPKPMGSDKKKPGAAKVTPNRRGLPERKVELLPKRGNQPSPKMPIPSGPRKPKATPKPSTTGPKKRKTLDDFLLKGKRPPMAPGQKKLPNDYDVIIKGFNDKNTINKYKKGK